MDFSQELQANSQTTAEIAVGNSVTSQLETGSDTDWFRVQLIQGERYQFDLSASGQSDGLSDPLLRLYQNDQIVSEDNDAGPGLDPRIIFTAPTTGTYYLEAASPATQSGEYLLDVTNLSRPAVTTESLSLTQTIDWGTSIGTTSVDVYFAVQGESFGGHASFGWTDAEIGQVMAAFAEFEAVSDLTFNRVQSPENAEFKLVIGSPIFFSAAMGAPGETDAGVGIFSRAALEADGGLVQGSTGFKILLHEFGHGLGLAHPHDTGGDSTKLSGVGLAFGDHGDYDLNQGVFTTLSYNNGYRSETGREPTDTYGVSGTLSPLDIAVLQSRYGANANANGGASTYELPSTNGFGTFYSAIWDTGGIDLLRFDGSADATLDLRAATLEYEIGGGGFVSKADGIFGGFTIANGVVIENAQGGSGDDTITGNAIANRLLGSGGSDTLIGGLGLDTLTGGSGADIFQFDAGDDGAIITDLTEQDVLRFESSGIAQAVLGTAQQSGADTVLTFNGSQITLRGIDDASLSQSGAEIISTVVSPSATQGDTTYAYTTSDGTITISTDQEDAYSGDDDRIVFTDLDRSDVEFVYSDGYLQVMWNNGAESGALNIAENGTHIERFDFTDGALLFDIDDVLPIEFGDGRILDNYAYPLYSAALNRTPDSDGLEFWSDFANSDVIQSIAFDPNLGQTAEVNGQVRLAAEFVTSSEFATPDTATNDGFVTKLYRNFLGRDPDELGFEFWSGVFVQRLDDEAPSESLPDGVTIFDAQSSEFIDITSEQWARAWMLRDFASHPDIFDRIEDDVTSGLFVADVDIM